MIGFRYENAISGICERSRIARAIANTSWIVVPFASERIDAAWITGPSAIGSENGMPSSIASAPAASSSSTMRGVSPSPHVTYAITPQRASFFKRLKSALTRFMRRHLRHVLVAAPAQIHQHHRVRNRIAHQPPERVRRLERGDDPFELAQL